MRLTRPDSNGWLLVAACFAVTLCIGEVGWSFGVFFKALENEFGWSRGVISWSYAGLAIAQGVSAIVAGRLADRYPPRLVLLGSVLISAPAIMSCSLISSVMQLQLLMFLAGLGTGATTSVPLSTVQKYFRNRARGGAALAVVASGIGIGALVFAPLINFAILTIGWRNAFIAAGLTFAVIVGGAALVMRPTAIQIRHDDGQPRKPRTGVRKLLMTPQFAGVAGMAIVATFAFQAMSVHLVPFATDAGISVYASAAALGLVGGFSVPGRLVSGLVSQRVGWGKTLAVALAGSGLMFLALPGIHTDWMLYCFVGLYGFCHGVRAVAVLGLVARLFGIEALGELTGIVVACGNSVGALGPYFAGHIFDLFGSYNITFVSLGVLLMLSAIVPLTLRFDARAADIQVPAHGNRVP